MAISRKFCNEIDKIEKYNAFLSFQMKFMMSCLPKKVKHLFFI